MNKIIIFGNGFDLAHGLPTSYKDFINYYLDNIELSLKQNLYYSDEFYGINESRNYYVTQLDFSKERPYLNFFKRKFKFNHKSAFFNSIITKSFNNWVDIENEYYLELKRIKNYKINRHEKNEMVRKLNLDFNNISKKLRTYLLEEVEKKYNFEVNRKVLEVLGKGVKEAVTKMRYNEFTFISFNYTRYVSEYFTELSESISSMVQRELFYLHGDLLDNDNSIIFGYGDELDSEYEEIEKLNDNEFLKNIKSFNYSRDNTYQNIVSNLNIKKFEVHLIGHSCGLSDRTFLNTLFEHKNCNKIKIHYYKDLKGYNNVYYNISRCFNDKKKMRVVIEPFTNSISFPQTKLSKN